MNSRISVYSPMGNPLGELEANTTRAWVLNGYGDAEFTVATNDPKANSALLNIGNIVRIEHPTLPTWDGWIDLPREWSERTIKVKCVELAAILDWRYGPISSYGLGGLPIDTYIRWLLNTTNAYYFGGIHINEGYVYAPGIHAAINSGVRLKTLFDAITRKYGIDWSITGQIDSGKFAIYANIYKDLLGVHTHFVLDNSNTMPNPPIMKEEGPLYNHVTVYSEAEEGGARNYATSYDEDSIAQYGLRATAEQAKGSGTAEIGLMIAADYLLQTYKHPRRKIAPVVLNVGDTFENMRLGNVFYWRDTNVGFDNERVGSYEDGRIIGMEYDDETDQLTLVADLAFQEFNRKQFIEEWRARYGRRI